MRIWALSLLAMLGAALAACGPSSESWRKDPAKFVDAMAEKARTEAQKVAGDYPELTGKPVEWTLTFKGVRAPDPAAARADTNADSVLDFDTEAIGARHVFFSGKPVMLMFRCKPDALDAWRKIPPGTSVRFQGVTGRPLFMVMTPGNDPSHHYAVAMASIENARPLP